MNYKKLYLIYLYIDLRSCGQIFCADCSDYRASLPDKRLYTTVRLCASCYNNQVSHTTNNNTSTNQVG